MIKRPLLTIAVPTYNRATYLEICLLQIYKQYKEFAQDLELIVSDNNSSDNTTSIVQRFIGQGLPLVYLKNHENVGADRNFVNCFKRARGKYVLIFGDDDVLLDGSLGKILSILRGGKYGNIYINSYGFKNDYIQERPPAQSSKETVFYNDATEYIQRLNFWVTFSSGNIVNKSLIEGDIDPCEFLGTNMVQLNWILSSIFTARTNVYIDEYLVAYKVANTGGYQLCQVFGVNINKVFDYFVKRGISPQYFKIINNKLLQSFFPNLILSLKERKKNGFEFIGEDYYKTLSHVFRKYAAFWLVVVPVIKLPFTIASPYYKIVNVLVQIFNKIRRE
jgi:glycosyltransferase involved in cell wall biosynthesis